MRSGPWLKSFHSSWLGPTLAGLLVLSRVEPAHGSPGEGREPPPVEVVVDTSKLDEANAERLAEALDMRLVAGLVALGVDVVGDAKIKPNGAKLVASIELRDAELLDYAIHLELVFRWKRETLIESMSCLGCSEHRVVEQVVELLPAVAGRLAAEAVSVVRVPVVESVQRLGPVGIAGISAFTGGVATIVTGGVLLQAGRVAAVRELALPCRAGFECLALPHGRWTGEGVAFIVAGGVATTAGLIATILDLTVLDRKRRAVVGVGATPSSAFIQLSARF